MADSSDSSNPGVPSEVTEITAEPTSLPEVADSSTAPTVPETSVPVAPPASNLSEEPSAPVIMAPEVTPGAQADQSIAASASSNPPATTPAAAPIQAQASAPAPAQPSAPPAQMTPASSTQPPVQPASVVPSKPVAAAASTPVLSEKPPIGIPPGGSPPQDGGGPTAPVPGYTTGPDLTEAFYKPPTPDPASAPTAYASTAYPHATPIPGCNITMPEEAASVTAGLQRILPVLQRRLDAALQQLTPIKVNFNALLNCCPSPQARLKTAEVLLKPSTGISALASPPALERLVSAFERSCVDPAVRAMIAASIKEIHIYNIALTERQPATFLLQQGPPGFMVWADNFSLGYGKISTKVDIMEFLENRFHCQERPLVRAFLSDTLPRAQDALRHALQRDIEIECHIPTILGHYSGSNRLRAAKTLVSEVGAKAAVDAASDKLEEVTISALNAAEKLFSKPQSKPSAKRAGRVDSPNVLLPLVIGFQRSCAYLTTMPAVIGSALNKIVIQSVPEDGRKSLSIHQSASEPPLQGDAFVVQEPPKDCALVVRCSLAKGPFGCFTIEDHVLFLEHRFRCLEQAHVASLMNAGFPPFLTFLEQRFGRKVSVEIKWETIFYPGLDPSKRVGIARTIGQFGSEKVVKVMGQALLDIMEDSEDKTATAVLQANIDKIVIQGIPGQDSRATLFLTKLEDGRSVMVYSCALEAGQRGTLSVLEFKTRLRTMLGIPTPRKDTGFKASAARVSDELSRLGDQVSATFSNIRFW